MHYPYFVICPADARCCSSSCNTSKLSFYSRIYNFVQSPILSATRFGPCPWCFLPRKIGQHIPKHPRDTPHLGSTYLFMPCHSKFRRFFQTRCSNFCGCLARGSGRKDRDGFAREMSLSLKTVTTLWMQFHIGWRAAAASGGARQLRASSGTQELHPEGSHGFNIGWRAAAACKFWQLRNSLRLLLGNRLLPYVSVRYRVGYS